MAQKILEDVEILNEQNQVVIRLDAKGGSVSAGGKGVDGNLSIFGADADNQTWSQATISLESEKEGRIVIRKKINNTLQEVMRFEVSESAFYIGSQGKAGKILVRDNTGVDKIIIDGEVSGQIVLKDNSGKIRIHLDGKEGDIKLEGADCAEEFDVAELEDVEPGTVLVINNKSKLCPCSKPYDKKVAGVVSGGNGYKPGIILDRKSTQNKRTPIALTGKVYCKVDSRYSPIEVGDLLTTSPTRGYAMKAKQQSKAFGAVIGKSLCPLKDGKGLIPILVALQ